MVAKLRTRLLTLAYCLNLAKIHMVAKHCVVVFLVHISYLLAKIHMVAKLLAMGFTGDEGYLLAKIHMVAKP